MDADEHEERRDRLVTLGLVAASIAHELRNPLSVIESSAFLLRKLVADERGRRHVETIAKQVVDCNRIVSALLELTRAGPVERRPLPPEDVFTGAIAQAVVPEAVAIVVDVEDGALVHGNGALLVQAVANLVMNAVRALGGRRGTIRLTARVVDDRTEIEVADDGPGFDPAILPRAFEPLVTGSVAGLGLGLALVRSIAERHEGSVVAENLDDGGAVVRLLLPASEGGRQ
jgi:signal transduction histidine kinase